MNVNAHASEHIAFIQKMLKKHSASSDRKQTLLKQLEFAEQRAADPNLNLAVLGEFSSGKSTFINALLRQRLLKSARVATTASATYITFSPTLNVKATFLDGSCISATALDTTKLSGAITQITARSVGNLPIRTVIDLLTSNQTVADKVRRVDISLPNRHLKSGLSIIDTPGIGAGSDHTKMHSQIAQAVVEQSADAAIVLIPSAQPMSSTLLAFLQSTARHFLHRCIFVVTAMDNQDSEEQRRVLGFVYHCLTKKLGLRKPSLYECAAVTALPVLGKIPVDKQPIWLDWQQAFYKLETLLVQEVARQRNLIISEKLIYLFQALLVELKADVQARQNTIERGEKQLQENSIEALESVLSQLLEQGSQRICAASSRCSTTASASKSGFRARVRSKAHSIIDSGSRESIHNYSSAVEPILTSAAEVECRQFLQTVDNDVQQLKQCFKEVSIEFNHHFEKSYTMLTSFGSSITIPPVALASLSVPSVGFSSAVSLAKQVQQADKRTGTGTYAGAAVGFLVMGPVGAAAGAALGRVMGSSGQKSLRDDYRQEIKQQVDQDIDRYVEEVTREIELLKENAIAELRAIAQTYLVEYSAAVNEILQQHSVRERRLTLKAKDIRRDMHELIQRQRQLEALSSQIAAA